MSVIPWALGFLGLASGGFICDALAAISTIRSVAPKLVMIACRALAG